jgi:hypothetical protein
LFVGAQEGLDLGAQGWVMGTGAVQERGPLGWGIDLQGLGEERFFRQRRLSHGQNLRHPNGEQKEVAFPGV